MKNFYSLLSLLGFYFNSAQEYIPITNSNNHWKVQFTMSFMASGNCPGLTVNHDYFFGEEVSINGKVYLELFKKYEDNALATWQIIEQQCPNEGFPTDLMGMTVLEDIHVGYLRDDIINKKVYFLKNGDTEENELYNFSYPYGNTVIEDYHLIKVSNTKAFGLNTTQQEHRYQGTYVYHDYYGIGNIADLIHHWYSLADLEGGGFRLLGFSNDNGVTFFNKENNILSNLESDNINQVNIYPNPAKETLNIKTNKPVKSTSIYSLDGIKIFETNSENLKIEHLNTGTYIIIVSFKDGSVYKNKFIKK